MTAATQPSPTVRTFLLGSGPDGDTAVLQRSLSEHGAMDHCARELARLTHDARRVADETLASASADLLNLDLGDLLIHAWRTHERLVEAAHATLATPGRQEVVQLGSHQITSTHYPTVDLFVDGVRIHTFRFRVTVVFQVEVAAAVIQGGELIAVQAGDPEVTGTLTLVMPGGDVELACQQRKINLHLRIPAGNGIPLLTAPDLVQPRW